MRERSSAASTLPLLCVLSLGACRDAGGEPGAKPAEACVSDGDCVYAPKCCGGCGDLTAPFAMVTRAEAERRRAACDPDRECPVYDCAAPPPCVSDFVPACVAGRCTVRLVSVSLQGGAIGPCNCEGCGPPPELGGDEACVSYRQMMYERCCCLHSGVARCDPGRWPGWNAACAMRDRCADAAAIARAPDLDGCRVDPGQVAPPARSSPAFAAQWVAAAKSPPRGARLLLQGAVFDPVSGERHALVVRGRGAPSSPALVVSPDGASVVMSGGHMLAFTRPEVPAAMAVVRAFGVGEGPSEVRAVTADLATLLMYEPVVGGSGSRWWLVRYDPGLALFGGWTRTASAGPAALEGALAPDGEEAVVELGCAPETDPKACRARLVLVSLDGVQRPLPMADARAASWLSDTRLLVEASEAPRIVTVERAALRVAPWREAAWSPAVGGARVAYLVPAATCHDGGRGRDATPGCEQARLETSTLEGADVRVVAEDAWFVPRGGVSADGAWVVYASRRLGARVLVVCRSEGGGCREIGDAWPHGWLL